MKRIFRGILTLTNPKNSDLSSGTKRSKKYGNAFEDRQLFQKNSIDRVNHWLNTYEAEARSLLTEGLYDSMNVDQYLDRSMKFHEYHLLSPIPEEEEANEEDEARIILKASVESFFKNHRKQQMNKKKKTAANTTVNNIVPKEENPVFISTSFDGEAELVRILKEMTMYAEMKNEMAQRKRDSN